MADGDKKIFLTGASFGIGLETAQLLCSHGFSVWGTSRDLARLPALQNFHPVTMDLTNPKSIRENFSLALKEAGQFDVLINNAGAGWFGPVEMQTDELVREQFQLMVHGPLELIRLALPQMRQRNRGLIINVTSLAARFPIPYLGTYSATKAALSSFSENLRYELAQTGIRITDLQPGDIHTHFHAATKRVDDAAPAVDKPRIAAAWNTIDRNMAVAPQPQLVANTILRIINSPNPPPVVTAGNFFQTRIATVLARLVPRQLVEWGQRKYYGI